MVPWHVDTLNARLLYQSRKSGVQYTRHPCQPACSTTTRVMCLQCTSSSFQLYSHSSNPLCFTCDSNPVLPPRPRPPPHPTHTPRTSPFPQEYTAHTSPSPHQQRGEDSLSNPPHTIANSSQPRKEEFQVFCCEAGSLRAKASALHCRGHELPLLLLEPEDALLYRIWLPPAPRGDLTYKQIFLVTEWRRTCCNCLCTHIATVKISKVMVTL